MERKRIVVLGAGHAGCNCANVLERKFSAEDVEVIVVERKIYSLNKMGGARGVAHGQAFANRLLIPNERLVPEKFGKVIHAEIVSVNEKAVHLKNIMIGDELTNEMDLEFDYLVCATGAQNLSVCEPPGSLRSHEQMLGYFDNVFEKISSANKILVVGGGSVGVELSCEIRERFGESKTVTLANAQDRLLSGSNIPATSWFYSFLNNGINSLGVNIILGEKVILETDMQQPFIEEKNAIYITDKGTKIEADLVLMCFGIKPNNEAYPKEWVNSSGQLMVKDTLQLVSDKHTHIFAIGDVNDFKESKQAYFTLFQAKTAASNIARMINVAKSKKKENLQRYQLGLGTGRPMMVVPTGSKSGATYFFYVPFGGLLTSLAKGKTLFVKDTWQKYHMSDDDIPPTQL